MRFINGKMSAFRSALLYALIASLLLSCEPQILDISWFEDNACLAPCWNHIEPGVTDVDDVLLFLNNQSIIETDSIRKLGISPYYFEDFIEAPIDNSDMKVRIGFYQERVSIIQFIRQNARTQSIGSLGISLGDVIVREGQPKYVGAAGVAVPSGFGDRIHEIVFLINPEVGYVISYDKDALPEEQRDLLLPDYQAHELIFFYPGDFQEILDAGFLGFSIRSENDLTRWEGYSSDP